MLFSSDVSARGVDYPDVSLVMQVIHPSLSSRPSVRLGYKSCMQASRESWAAQVGLPADRDQYIHRVGRTARAGKQGQAVLLLQDFEQQFLGKLQGLPVKLAPALPQQASCSHLALTPNHSNLCESRRVASCRCGQHSAAFDLQRLFAGG